jgi:hypothetical protein
MSADPHWRYVQARLQSRHGDRLTEAAWHALEAAQTADAFLDRARGTPLVRFTEQVSAAMNPHAMERALRGAWRTYVNEIAGWLPLAWQPAVSWTSLLPDLPAIDALLKGEMPAWAKQEPTLALFTETDPAQRLTALQASPFAPLLPREGESVPLGARWARHWRSLWPKQSAADRRALNALAHAVQTHIARPAQAGPQETSETHRRDLEKAATRLFRRHDASPTTVFGHLALTALDLERLRGGLARRRLFAPRERRQAA